MLAIIQTSAVLIGITILLNSIPGKTWAGSKDQAGTVAAELSAIAHHLSLRPKTAIDLSGVSGEYCFNLGLGEGAQMTHFAIDPAKTQEDVIDFVNAAPLMKDGMKLEGLPRFPGKLGAMTPNQWYFLPAGELEPHHGIKFPFPIMMKASDIS